jgi:hypothetical protein
MTSTAGSESAWNDFASSSVTPPSSAAPRTIYLANTLAPPSRIHTPGCHITFADETPDEAPIAKTFFYPWWHSMSSNDTQTCYHSQVRLGPKRDGLLVDTGAVNSLTGDEFIDRIAAAAKSHGQGVQINTLEHPFPIEGVGTGASQVTKRATVPLALGDGSTGNYTAAMVEHSQLPGLLGLEPMIKSRVLLDSCNMRFITVGAGGFKLELSPGSTVRNLERSATGHLMLPITEWEKNKGQKGNLAFPAM